MFSWWRHDTTVAVEQIMCWPKIIHWQGCGSDTGHARTLHALLTEAGEGQTSLLCSVGTRHSSVFDMQGISPGSACRTAAQRRALLPETHSGDPASCSPCTPAAEHLHDPLQHVKLVVCMLQIVHLPCMAVQLAPMCLSKHWQWRDPHSQQDA